MATKTVSGKLTDATNTPVAGAVVVAKLSAPAIIAGTEEVAPTSVYATTAPDGTWSLLLQANLDLVPSSTYYAISVGAWSCTAVVPQSAGPFTIEAIMAAPPAVSPPAALDSAVVHLANAETIVGQKSFSAPLVLGGGPWYDPLHPSFGAKFDGKQVDDATVTLNQPGITLSAGDIAAGGPVPGGFVNLPVAQGGDVGKIFCLLTGGTVSFGTIASVQSTTQATMSTNAGASSGAGIFQFATVDTAALQAWWAKVVAGSGRQVTGPGGAYGLLPMGMALIDAPISTDQQSLGAFKIVGAGKGAATGHCSLIACAHATAFASSPMFNVPNLKSGTLRDFSIFGNYTAWRGFQAIEGTPGPPPAAPSGETSTFNRFEDLYIAGCVDFQIYLDGTEDTMFWGCHFSAIISLDHNSTFVNAPGGQFSFTDCGLMGVTNLCYQIASCYGCTIGPLLTNNPASLATLCLTLVACYMYDAATHNCMSAVDRFTDVVAIGCFLIASVKFDWVRGQIILGVGLKFSGCGFLQSGGLSGQNAAVYCVTADGGGTGSVSFDTCSASAFSSFANSNRHTFRNVNTAAVDCLAYNNFPNSFSPPDSLVVATGNTGASGAWAINNHNFALEVIVNVNGATLTAPWFRVSPDGGTTAQDTGYPVGIGAASKILRPGHAVQFNYSAGQPKAAYYQAA